MASFYTGVGMSSISGSIGDYVFVPQSAAFRHAEQPGGGFIVSPVSCFMNFVDAYGNTFPFCSSTTSDTYYWPNGTFSTSILGTRFPVACGQYATIGNTTPFIGGIYIASGIPVIPIGFPTESGLDGYNGIGDFHIQYDPILIITPSPPALAAGAALNVQLSATNGCNTNPTFTVSSGSLPAGVSLSSSGLLSGTPALIQSYDFTVLVTSDICRTMGSLEFSGTVAPHSQIDVETDFSQTMGLAPVNGDGVIIPSTTSRWKLQELDVRVRREERK